MSLDSNLGPETKLKLEIVAGKLKMSADYVGTDLAAGAYIATTGDQLVDAIGKLIPGDSAAEHAALAVVKLALNNLTV